MLFWKTLRTTVDSSVAIILLNSWFFLKVYLFIGVNYKVWFWFFAFHFTYLLQDHFSNLLCINDREYELWYVSDFSHLKKSYIIVLKSKWLLLLILNISTPKWAWHSALACSPEHIEKRHERISVIGGKPIIYHAFLFQNAFLFHLSIAILGDKMSFLVTTPQQMLIQCFQRWVS